MKDKVLNRGGDSTAYVLLVNFGTPMHYLVLDKVYQKMAFSSMVRVKPR